MLAQRGPRLRRQHPQWSSRHALTRFVSLTLAYLISLWGAWALWHGDGDALGWLVAVVFCLLLNATGNCRDLLKAIGQPAA